MARAILADGIANDGYREILKLDPVWAITQALKWWVFEANTNMLVQNFYDERFFEYKRSAYKAIASAFNAMIREHRSLA